VRRFGRPLYEFYVLDHVSKNVGVPPSGLPALWGRQRIGIPDVATALRQLSGRPAPSRTSYYPQGGIGRIVAALADAVRRQGGAVRTNSTVVSWGHAGGNVRLRARTGDRHAVRTVDAVINTGPVDTFLRCADEGTVPSPVRRAAGRLRYRATVFVYLSTDDTAAGVPCDLCYFPQEQVFTRVYSPEGYTGASAPGTSTGFCFEIHCDPGDGLWDQSDADLGRRTVRDAGALPFFGAAARLRVERVVRVRRHYPLSAPGSPDLTAVDGYLDGMSPSVVSAGRLGSHRYVNMDSAMRMGALAAEAAYGLRGPRDIRRVADEPVFVEDGRRRR
jgi:protoporphyrinogen oxidase